MFILDGKPLSPDVAFTHDGIQYPANWLRLATPEEREAIGITEVPDPAPYDQRFYWGPDLPKDHAQLVQQWVGQTRATAGTLLQTSDWMVIRETDNGTPVPDEWRAWRESIRAATGVKVVAIEATTTTEELAAYITGADYPIWPLDPSSPTGPISSVEKPEEETAYSVFEWGAFQPLPCGR
jgi:hypothetical protein